MNRFTYPVVLTSVLFSSTATMAQIISIKPLTEQQQHEAMETAALAINIKAIAPDAIAPSAPLAALPIQRVWTLQTGQTIGQNLKAWAETAQWSVLWNMTKDWTVPAPTAFMGEFPDAAEEVIKTLASNGALIRAQIFEGNKTIVVTGTGVAQQ